MDFFAAVYGSGISFSKQILEKNRQLWYIYNLCRPLITDTMCCYASQMFLLLEIISLSNTDSEITC